MHFLSYFLAMSVHTRITPRSIPDYTVITYQWFVVTLILYFSDLVFFKCNN